MKSGVSFPSYYSLPVWAADSGAADAADYPVTNLSDLKRIRRVWRAAAVGQTAKKFTLPAAKALQFLGLSHHNAPVGAAFRFQLFSDAGLTAEVADTGVQPVWPLPNLLPSMAAVPPALPVNWETTLAGLTFTTVGSGTEDGDPYIDIRFQGVANNTSAVLYFAKSGSGSNSVAASRGQTIQNFFKARRVGGSAANVTDYRAVIVGRSSVGTFLTTTQTSWPMGVADALPFNAQHQLTSLNTAVAQPGLMLIVTNGAAVDITIRIIGPVTSIVPALPAAPQVRPVVLAAPVNAIAGRLTLYDRAPLDNVAWEIGGVEMGGWWEWQDVEVPRERGRGGSAIEQDLGGGVTHVTKQWLPRTWRGERGVVDQSEVETTALDFQLEKRKTRPFVFVHDYDDPSTWPRESLLVTNQSLLPSQIFNFDVGRVGFDFLEHLG